MHRFFVLAFVFVFIELFLPPLAQLRFSLCICIVQSIAWHGWVEMGGWMGFQLTTIKGWVDGSVTDGWVGWCFYLVVWFGERAVVGE